jgi:hypothetical protein
VCGGRGWGGEEREKTSASQKNRGINSIYATNLSLFVSAQFKVLASLQRHLLLLFARRALHSQYDLLCGFGLLPEHRLGLTSVPRLLAVITTLP